MFCFSKIRFVLSPLFVTGFLCMGTVSVALAQDTNDVLIDPAIIEMIMSPDVSSAIDNGKDAEDESLQKLEEALRYAYVNNPTLRAARAGLHAVHEEFPQAQAGWKPLIDASTTLSDSTIDGSNFGGAGGTTSTEVGVGFNQPLYRGGRTMAAMDVADSNIMAQRFLLRGKEQSILLDVATAYMDVLRDKSLLELSDSNRSVIERQREATRYRFDVGELTKTDIAQSDARMAEAEAEYVKALGALRKTQSVYEQVVGLKPGELASPSLFFPIPDSLDESLSLAEKNNPDILFSEYIHKAAENGVDTIFGELLPELSLFGNWSRQYDPQPGLIKESTTKTVGLSASIPLYEGGAVRSRVRQAKYTANQRHLEILEIRRFIRQEAVAHWEDLLAARAEIRAREAQVKASYTAQEGVHEETDLGTRTILDALDADQEYLDAQVALVTTQRDEIVATFALAATLGLLDPETLGFPDVLEDYAAHFRATKSKILGMDVKIDEGER